MERPHSYNATPTIEEIPPDDLADLVKRKGPVTIAAIVEAYARSLPDLIKHSLVEFLTEGPLDQVWHYDLLQIENFPSENARAEYLDRMMGAHAAESADHQQLMALRYIQRDVNRQIIAIVRCRHAFLTSSGERQ